MKELKKINKILVNIHKQKKKEYYRKVLKELIDDLEGRTYLEKGKDSTIWEEV